jgi:peroxiredoxin
MKTLLICGSTCGAMFLVIAGTLGLGLARGESPQQTVHKVAHAVGVSCCGGQESGGSETSTSHDAADHDPYCRKPGEEQQSNASQEHASTEGLACAPDLTEAASADIELTEDEKVVVSFIADQLMTGSPPAFEDSEIQEATGVSVDNLDEGVLRTGVVQEILSRGVDLNQLFAASTCSQLSACSVHRNLAGAQGEELDRYHAEKALDGKTYASWKAPGFNLPSTAGEMISLAAAHGRPVAVVLLSGHCTHSMDTLPVLVNLREKYAAEDLTILPIYVNSGSVEDVRSWSSRMNLNYPLLVDESKTLSDQYESYLVPSTFLIDADGQVTRKLVGFKDQETLDRAFHDLTS